MVSTLKTGTKTSRKDSGIVMRALLRKNKANKVHIRCLNSNSMADFCNLAIGDK